MRFASLLAALFPLATACAQNTITVKVGGGVLAYDPPSVNASAGDIVAFQFLDKNHTVTQSTFASPCEVMTTPTVGIDSGFQAVAANSTTIPQWSITVTNASTPLWFFCRQAGHCQKGMVFAINPTAEKSYSAFLANAMGSGTPAGSPSASSPSGGPNPVASPNGALGSNASSSGAISIRSEHAVVSLTVFGLLASLVL